MPSCWCCQMQWRCQCRCRSSSLQVDADADANGCASHLAGIHADCEHQLPRRVTNTAVFCTSLCMLQVGTNTCCLVCRCPDDSHQLYAVLSGSVSLVHGDAGDQQLQQLLVLAEQRQQQAADQAAAEAATAANSASTCPLGELALDVTGSYSCAHRCSATEPNPCRISDASVSAEQPRSRGIWHQVKEEVSAAQKRQIHSSMATGSIAGAAAPAAGAADNPTETGASKLGLDTAALKCISLGAAGPGQCFWWVGIDAQLQQAPKKTLPAATAVDTAR
jgi:hypothetical protein